MPWGREETGVLGVGCAGVWKTFIIFRITGKLGFERIMDSNNWIPDSKVKICRIPSPGFPYMGRETASPNHTNS